MLHRAHVHTDMYLWKVALYTAVPATGFVSMLAYSMFWNAVANRPVRKMMVEGQAELQTYIDKIKAEGATKEVFAKYALERSDCGSYRQGGDLGMFGPGEMQKQFEDGTAATPVGSMSGIVLSDSDYHIIFRYA